MEGFDEIYTQYYHVVYAYILRLCKDPELAGEITQEAFFKALKSIDGFKGQCTLQAWLCQIAKNTYFTLLRKRGRHQPLSDGLPAPEYLEEQLEDKEAAMGIYKALHTLPEPYREVFWLRTLGELSFSQIAGLFEKTESWARVTYHRAKIKIIEGLS